MANHSSGDQVTYVLQWFNSWSDFQKDDFIHVIAPKVSPGQYVNGLVNGLQNLDTSGRPPSLFACQIKLFNDWWNSWNEADHEKFTSQLKVNDGKFWSEVESELSGTRKKVDEDFFTVTVTTATASIIPIANKNKGSCDSNNPIEGAEAPLTETLLPGSNNGESHSPSMEVENHSDESHSVPLAVSDE